MIIEMMSLLLQKLFSFIHNNNTEQMESEYLKISNCHMSVYETEYHRIINDLFDSQPKVAQISSSKSIIFFIASLFIKLSIIKKHTELLLGLNKVLFLQRNEEIISV